MSSRELSIKGAVKLYESFEKVGVIFQSLILLLFRINWGWQFYESGLGKLWNHGRTANYFANLGIPLPELNAWFVGGVECLGGLLLLVGLASRPTGLILAISMTVAYLTADRNVVINFFSNQDAFFHASPFLFWLSAILVFSFGSGKISIDHLLNEYFRKKQES